jgi:DNA-directed RNA polymerase subunit E'
MYLIYEFNEWVDVPANVLVENVDIDEVVKNVLRDRIEGQGDPELGIFIALIDARVVGDGVFLPYDPDIYLPVRYRVLTFKPEPLEIVKGRVKDAKEHGIFVSLGPIDGFIYRDQIMDEKVEFDPGNLGFRGIDSKRMVKVGDIVRARITQIGKGGPRVFRIGMTMRQPYLGKEEWIEEARKSGE